MALLRSTGPRRRVLRDGLDPSSSRVTFASASGPEVKSPCSGAVGVERRLIVAPKTEPELAAFLGDVNVLEIAKSPREVAA